VVKRRIEWIEDLAGVIARAHSCEIFVCQGLSSVWFVGRKSDAKIAEYLFIVLQRAAEKIAHSEYMKFRRQMRQEADGDTMQTATNLEKTHGFKASFLTGFIQRLMQRFSEEKQKMEHDYTGTALMRINKEALAVRKYVEERKGKPAKSLGGNQSFNAEGYRRGRAMADGMRINCNAINAERPNQQLK
jgi:hypothetical protein